MAQVRQSVEGLAARRLLAVGLLLLAASSAAGQAAGDNPAGDKAAGQSPACGLKLADAPDVKGLRLGLTTRHVFELFPGSAEDPTVRSAISGAADKLGVANVVIRPEAYASNTAYAGVNQVLIKFIEGRVSSFTVGLNAPEWPHVDDFVAKFREGTSLPAADAWEPYVGLDTQLKILTCDGFVVRVFAGGKNAKINYVRMIDTEAEDKLRERKEKARAAGAVRN